MPNPIAVCIEDLDPGTNAERFLRCVALVGRRPGLALSCDGRVVYQSEEPVAAELWVSADERFVLFRPEHSDTPVVVRRSGRSLQVPAGKPVVLLGRDEIDVGQRRLRIHVHGAARVVQPPAPFVGRSRGAAAALAAAVAVGAAAVSCGGQATRGGGPTAPTTDPSGVNSAKPPPEQPPPIEVRDEPPEIPPEPE